MKIALIGATGFIGSQLLQEAVQRGHQVTALVQHPEKVPALPGVRAQAINVQDTAALTQALRGHDVVISAFSGHAQTDVLGYFLQGFQSILSAAKAAPAPRLLVVGGAGSLEVAPGLNLLDTPQFPAEWKASAEGARQALRLLQAEPELEWTLLSPAAMLAPGERTGVFRLGGDQLMTDAEGQSRISVADYAVAMLDEMEKPAHPRQRFSVAY
ncbi:NAD(P)-dependent oxidoreductase [Paucibacter sp. Y2R2-4]|uniref:NAD(P)-dependent oxidoreductase n=1 Tax=Paucibacter sp. Y2R2-4 TaxID=2893553 RepID=UPI0021E40037|nr:NAD(P)-dependent oxidoreductase [Paucibacter sp. Y2R2-4]MCV2349652.1 NAD(P)-dependent oxidoreductase [Paucibacter sp. Y2R2-4]